jgi:uncharacterized protein (TIGR00369 family)
MPLLELPHTAGCLVCGRDNPHGLHLHLHVDEESARVETTFTPGPHHIGFEGIVHGGVLATVLDEAMVWAATWQRRRFCVCGEMTVRFRQSPPIGRPLRITAEVSQQRARLVQTTGSVADSSGQLIVTATGKYVPLDDVRHRAFAATFLREPATARAASHLLQE